MHVFSTAFNGALEYLLGLTGDWFIAIVLLTLAIRLVMFPLSVKQQKAMIISQNLGEVRKSLSAKFENQTEKVNKCLARVMTHYKINPLLPFITIVIQAPVFFSLYFSLLHLSTTVGSTLIPWILTVSNPDSLHVLPVIGSFLQGISGLTAQNKSLFMFILPVSLGLIFLWKAPAALSVYWGINALLSFIERKIIFFGRFQKRFLNVASTEEMLKSVG
ncbi:MAG TPA: membrane protein insertase YidC [Syntrophomonadaceae bacterium]|nr:membrane protein insertase YidC [Syntrophomonadaceae bacterium]